jgi:SsrA-binding protein
MARKKKKKDDRRIVADNKKARRNYEIDRVLEAGIVLTGSEIKSIRCTSASLAESYASAEGNELFLINANIPVYEQAGRYNHAPKRPRKLLLHRKEIDNLANAVQREGMTIVPLKLYFNKRGIAKLEIAVARGRKMHDKRQLEKDRSWKRDQARIMRDRG